MTGGLMNLVSYGEANVIVHGNPKKTFFKTVFHKHTNFGMQRFRIDFEGQRNLQFNNDTVFDFKLPRYGDLIHDTYLVVNIPSIWSGNYDAGGKNATYNFNWANNLGSTMIRQVDILSGSSTLASFPGEYLHFIKERDLTAEKKKIWDEMIGNVDELKNPAKYVRKHMQNEDFMPNFIKGSSFSTAQNNESIDHHKDTCE